MRQGDILTFTLAIFTLFLSWGVCEDEAVLRIEGTLGEGTPILTSTGFPIALYTEPDETSERIKFMSVPRGEELRIEERDCAVIVRKAGAVKVESTASLQGESYGNVSILQMTASTVPKNFTFPGGSMFEHLMLTHDGKCLVRVFNEILVVEECEWTGPNSQQGAVFSMIQPPLVEQWAKVSEGWVRIDGTKLPFDLRRETPEDEETADEETKGDREEDETPEGDREKNDN